jgi:hypothetical protein
VQAATRTSTDVGGSRGAEGKPSRSRPAGVPPQEERYPRWIAIAFANQIFASTETCAPETQVRTRLPPAQSLVRTFPSGSDGRNAPINGVKVGLAIPRQEGFMQTIAADREHRGSSASGIGNMPIWHSHSAILGESRAFAMPRARIRVVK